MPSPIIWQDDEKAITLIDVPTSIATAQGTSSSPCHCALKSCTPLQAPYPSIEPKTAKAKASITTSSASSALHSNCVAILQDALHTLRTGHDGLYCRPRTFVDSSPTKRKLSEIEFGCMTGTARNRPAVQANAAPDDQSVAQEVSKSDVQLTCNAAGDVAFVNPTCDTVEGTLTGSSIKHLNGCRYRIPPRASFFLGDCSNGSAFHAFFRSLNRPKFDFILMDPPWPNASVRRTHKTAGSTYGIMQTMQETQDLLAGLRLPLLMADDCLVGVWITNKEAVRELVLGENGLFETWGVTLVEEWLWLKVTTTGEPILPLDSAWRKPYEVLLLGRKGSAQPPGPPKRRVAVSVPDLHSRKPCLRSLIEPSMAKAGYGALEIFARHLVAGWCSWGNECIKFNETSNWRKDDDARTVVPTGHDTAHGSVA